MSRFLDFTNAAHTIKGAQSGPVVAILGGTHGDERIGVDIIDYLLQTLAPEKIHGEIRLILGNPSAYRQNKRYVDTDLNRLFQDNVLHSFESLETLKFEEARALELVDLLRDVDYALDIHATVKPTASNFAYVANSPKHLDIANLFSIDYVVCEQDENVTSYPQGPIDTYVDRHGGIGITLEAGWIGTQGIEDVIKNDVAGFLNYVGSTEILSYEPPVNTPQKCIIYKELKVEGDQFAFKENYGSFDVIPAGQIIAYEGTEPVRVDRDSYIIFPKMVLKPGAIAGYLAEKE